jgi:cell wall-associated NlpC family hydrolase
LDTPFHHQGRLKGVGVDCIGLVMGVARELGISDFEARDYSMRPNPKVLMGHVGRELIKISELKEGCILLFNIVSEPQHFGLYSKSTGTIIHSYSVIGRVVEEPFDAIWKRRLIAMFDYKVESWQA